MPAGAVRTPTLAEREVLMSDSAVSRTGFTPRSAQKLTTKRPPRSMLSVECRHVMRCDTKDSTHEHLPLSYQMWLEAGKQRPPFPERPDPSYNSNVWRNFRQQYGIQTDNSGNKMKEVIASMYPLNIPTPSKMGDHSYSKFLTETPLIRDEKLRELAIDRTTKDILDFKRLRLRSEARYPPLDKDGHIVPPVNFKKYADVFVPRELPEQEPTQPATETRVDMFGNVVPKLRTQPHLWKLTHRLNHPQYEQVQEEQQQRRSEPRHPPPLISSRP